MRSSPPQREERNHVQDPDAGHRADHPEGVAVAIHDGWHPIVARGRQQGECTSQDQRCKHAASDGDCGTPKPLRLCVESAIESSIGDHGKGQGRVPEHVQPCRCLGTRSQQTRRREQSGECQHVRDGHESGEEITARQRE